MEQLVFQVSAFSGPLDLLLQLIAAHKMDIYDIPISEILEQYLVQIDRMQQHNMALASELLEMAARLVYIKTAQLLPQSDIADEMKRQITEELLEYQAVQNAAVWLRRHNTGRAVFVREMAELGPAPYTYRHDPIELVEAHRLLSGRLLQKSAGQKQIEVFSDRISRKPVSVASKIVYLIRRLIRAGETPYEELFADASTSSERVATFLALLELLGARRLMLREEGPTQWIRMAPHDEQGNMQALPEL